MCMSKQPVFRRTTCRLCVGQNLRPVLVLEESPIGDDYVPRHEAHEVQKKYPLTVFQCEECGHAQLIDVISPEKLFRNYTFETSSSAGLIDHFKRYVDDLDEKFSSGKKGLVVEIGSNDGTLLGYFKDRGYDVAGVDPAENIAKRATEKGIPTRPQFFTQAVAQEILTKQGKAQFICANNVYAHADDLHEITKGIKSLLAPDGIFIFEVSYLPDLMERCLFDTIYHEHLCYHSISPLVRFFESLGLELFDVTQIATKGGSIRGFVQHKGGGRRRADTVDSLLAQEESQGMHTTAPFKKLSEHLMRRRNELAEILKEFKKQGRTIGAFGASVTATTFLYHFQLEDVVEIIVDDNKSKNGLLSPGSHIPVCSSELLYAKQGRPDVVVVLVWQYAETIMKKHQAFVDDGGIFITPLPEVKICRA